MVKQKNQAAGTKSSSSAPSDKKIDYIVPAPKETKIEKALRLGNDEVIAKAVQDLLKRDNLNIH